MSTVDASTRNRRDAIVRAFVETGFVAVQAYAVESGRRTKNLEVFVSALRREGYTIETQAGVGYLMDQENRDKLKASKRAARAGKAGGGPMRSILLLVPYDLHTVLVCEALDRGVSLEALTLKAVEAGVDVLLGPSSGL